MGEILAGVTGLHDGKRPRPGECLRCYPARTQAYEIHPQKQWRNSTSANAVTRSSAQPPASRTAPSRPIRAGYRTSSRPAASAIRRRWARRASRRSSPAWRPMRRCLRHAEPGVWLCCCFSTAKYCVSIGMTCPTKSRVVTILGSDVMVHNHAVTTSTARNEKTAQCAVFSSHLLPTHQGRRASASTSLALGSRSCLVTANGPMLSIGTATITEEITTITAPIMWVSARPSIDSPP